MNTHAQLKGLGLFDTKVPRYTSYPTAPQFSPTLEPDEFSSWLRAIPAGSDISLYLHVPFCRRLCWFCACRTQGTSTDAPVVAYVETLKAEIALLARHLAPGVRLSRLHWGGGTPTLLAPDLMRDLARAVFDAVPMGTGAEFSVEIDPNEIDAARLDALADAGMTRASIGVQDFDPEIQAAIGRLQGYEVTRDAADAIRARGVESLNADILFGLPHQTPARITASVEKLLTLAPDRVALYGYAHVPWMSKRQQMVPTDAMPSPEARLQLYEIARDLFLAAGYVEIGIDHFARPTDGLARAQAGGTLRRNFQGYTDDQAPVLVGLGASSISRFPQGFAQNLSPTASYAKAVRSGQFATHRGHVFAGEDLARARMIEALMCDFAVRRDDILHRFDMTPTRLDTLLRTAAAQFPGAVHLDADALSIPPAARPLTRMIARAFDAYAAPSGAHSGAI